LAAAITGGARLGKTWHSHLDICSVTGHRMATPMTSHIEFYNRVGACPVPAERCRVVRDASSNVPRGYFTLATPGDPIDFMLVAQNPGQADGREIGMYFDGAAVGEKHLEFTHTLFIDGRGGRFHRAVNEWVETITGLPLADAWRRCVYTNAVKCTTAENEKPCRAALSSCAQRWFRDEVNLWKPAMLVGLGGYAARALTSLGIPSLSMLHPSHREGKSAERQHLEALVLRLAEIRKRGSI